MTAPPSDVAGLAALAVKAQDISQLRDVLSRAHSEARMDATLQSLRCWMSFFDEDMDAGARLALHRSFAERFSLESGTFAGQRPPRWPLRVGYLSLSFHDLPRRSFVSALLSRHDPSRFAVTLYSRRDRELWAPHGSVSLAGLDANGIVQRIREDGLDILADLDGHRDPEFMLALSARMARVQISMPHYPGSLGLLTADYRFTDDRVESEEGHQGHYVEKLMQLPCCLNYSYPTRLPDIESTPPYKRNGFVTFGIFGQPIKCGPKYLRCVARVLNRSSTARLVFHHPFLGDAAPGGKTDVHPTIRHRLLQHFLDAGICPSRIAFVGALHPWDHLDFHNEVDVILDTAPFNGFTTTMDALLMGVPTMAVRGESFVDRTSAGALLHAGLPEFVAPPVEDWEDLAARFSAAPPSITNRRREVRERFQRCPLTDGLSYTRSIEAVYQSMVWR